MQRVRVGMTGLAAVLVLIALMSVVFTSATRDQPAATIGGSSAAVVANMTDTGNAAVEKGKDEPLAELGAAPSTASTEAVDAAAIARQQEAARRGQR